ncbi:hypothetical protein Q75_13475 [Bacillus coahuilensis p1.1.43]|uniref:Glycosyltransferase 2-like domain-containing protein n=1 Tax=Bacillus coahuilensis p1.1.43 TaxID=1150625 RepID=A0A147K611_9BACI|nr:glycosyltransferase family 2 protein [Bacillus coahuilensis]KUP05255.1 hypothetical protein Q75_13475 [Bacillus coahuilensis p1.1.43]
MPEFDFNAVKSNDNFNCFSTFFNYGKSNPSLAFEVIYPSVSIIISTYNQRNLYKKALESALGIYYPNLTVIVGDDCSTDDTQDLMEEYTEYTQLKYIRREKNLGARINTSDLLYNHCTSEFVMFLNHDDIVTDPTYINETIELFKKHPSLQLVWANCYIIDHNDKVHSQTDYDLAELTDGKEYFINYEIGEYKHITGMVTSVFRREKAIEMKCMLEESMALDLFLYLKLMLVGDVGFIKRKVAAYRINPQGISNNMKIEYDYTTINELEVIFELAKKYHFSTDQLDQWLLNRLALYFQWRLNTLIKQNEIEDSINLYQYIANQYPKLKEILSIQYGVQKITKPIHNKIRS